VEMHGSKGQGQFTAKMDNRIKTIKIISRTIAKGIRNIQLNILYTELSEAI